MDIHKRRNWITFDHVYLDILQTTNLIMIETIYFAFVSYHCLLIVIFTICIYNANSNCDKFMIFLL